jgi:murein DD-endopeptidase MepM/ murein hydrolase activator NlpD
MIPDVTLSGLTNAAGKPDPKAVAIKVQSMFTEIMLKSMEDSIGAEDGLFGGSASSDIYRGMLNEQVAAAMSSRMQSPLEGEIETALTRRSASTAPKQDEPGDAGNPSNDMPVRGVISSPQGWRRDPINGQTRYHEGTDIAAPAGTPVRAVAEGWVLESGSKGSYGNRVVIQTEDGRKMIYAHNNRNFVKAGDWVSRGEEIAEVGSTGRATGPHVHFEVKF